MTVSTEAVSTAPVRTIAVHDRLAVQGRDAPRCVQQQHQQLHHLLVVGRVLEHLGGIAGEGAQVAKLCGSSTTTPAVTARDRTQQMRSTAPAAVTATVTQQ